MLLSPCSNGWFGTDSFKNLIGRALAWQATEPRIQNGETTRRSVEPAIALTPFESAF